MSLTANIGHHLPIPFEVRLLSVAIRFFPINETLTLKVINLAWNAYIGESRFVRWKQAIRWSLAMVFQTSVADSWFKSLDSPEINLHLQTNPRLGLKPFRVYQSTRWNGAQRMKVIRETYQWLAGSGSSLNDAVLTGDPTTIASFQLRDFGFAEIRAGRDNRFRKEGEITLSLRLQGEPDFLIAMAISAEILDSGEWAMRIGCLQGGSGATRSVIRDVTKAMHGMRPKSLLIFIAQEIAQLTQISCLLGAGGDIQAHRRKRAIYIPFLHGLDFDYDTMWIEASGRRGPDGWFRIPLGYQRKSKEKMKPNKRAIYERRFLLLDEIENQIRSIINSGNKTA